MKALKNLKAPEGYIYNGLMCLFSWEFAKRKMRAGDAELYVKLKCDESTTPQKTYNDFCAKYLEKWETELPLEQRME